MPTIEGAGVHLKRGFGYHQVPRFDPFLMLDDFHTSDPQEYLAGFPWHPHRGIETITYMIEGVVEHGDSMGNRGVIAAGDVQWMTAGSGIIHQEMPQVSPSGTMWGFQLWANLPASQKMMAPRYRDVTAATIPLVKLASGAGVRLVSGRLEGVDGPVKDIVIEPELMDVTVPAGVIFEHHVKDGHTVVLYILSGSAGIDEGAEDFAPETVILLERAGDLVRVSAGECGARFLLFSGKPLHEPVAWQGPIVMNSREELRLAFEEYNNGTFIK